MSKFDKPAEELSIPELEALLARKKMEASKDRLRKFRRSGRALTIDDHGGNGPSKVELGEQAEKKTGGGFRWRVVLNRFLLVLEVAAVAGLGYLLVDGFDTLQQMNREVAEALEAPTPSPTALITAVVLPSGHTPPTSPGGAQPNEAEIPANLRPLVQSLAAVPVPTASPEQARNIFIERLWNGPVPVVMGDGWEQLKRGVGQHIGSANPGEKGNMVLSAHNDIFGELFRDLDQLRPGDEVLVSTASREFLYKVIGVRIVDPTDVSVMSPTEKPTITMISCYPYLVDNQRIVVFGELVQD
jgi:sortase A